MTYRVISEKHVDVATITCANLYEDLREPGKFFVRTGDDGSFVGTLFLNPGCRVELVKE